MIPDRWTPLTAATHKRVMQGEYLYVKMARGYEMPANWNEVCLLLFNDMQLGYIAGKYPTSLKLTLATNEYSSIDCALTVYPTPHYKIISPKGYDIEKTAKKGALMKEHVRELLADWVPFTSFELGLLSEEDIIRVRLAKHSKKITAQHIPSERMRKAIFTEELLEINGINPPQRVYFKIFCENGEAGFLDIVADREKFGIKYEIKHGEIRREDLELYDIIV